jgi:hypothetical protein
MFNDPLLLDSTLAGIAMTATWNSGFIDLGAKGTNTVSFHIIWQDVAITWGLYRSNTPLGAFASPPWDDFTADYRIGDPGWVDCFLGDPRTEHVVSFMNPGTRYVLLGYTGGNFGGANKYLRVIAHLNRVFY